MTKRIQKKIEFLAKPIKTSQANIQAKPISKPKTKPIKPNQYPSQKLSQLNQTNPKTI